MREQTTVATSPLCQAWGLEASDLGFVERCRCPLRMGTPGRATRAGRLRETKAGQMITSPQLVEAGEGDAEGGGEPPPPRDRIFLFSFSFCLYFFLFFLWDCLGSGRFLGVGDRVPHVGGRSPHGSADDCWSGIGFCHIFKSTAANMIHSGLV